MTGPTPHLTPEEKLLLSLCRLGFTEEQKSVIRDQIREMKDWDHFVGLANNQGIIALLAYNIRETGLTDLFPEEAMKVLDNGHMKSMIRNTWLAERWRKVNKILTAAGIKHVLLKGMALEYTVYGAKGLRQMTDSDILVKKADALKAWLLLQENGFIPDIIKSPLHRKIITDIGKHLPTLRRDDYAVEIHHRLFREAEKNEALTEAINNAKQIDIEGTSAFIPEDEIHLEFLKEHLNDHLLSGEAQLRQFLDLELIKPGSTPPFPDGFLAFHDPQVSLKQRKDAYRNHFISLPRRIRFRFIAGDIFPSLGWMRKRYNCSSVKAVLHYPKRLGKLVWLMKGVKALTAFAKASAVEGREGKTA